MATNFVLPKRALERIKVGQAFAEYDLIRNEPELFVSTPAALAALDQSSQKCFFVGRRGAGKTAITYELLRRTQDSISIVPQIFDLLQLPLAHDEFRDTRQRPFKSLTHTFERALLDECIRHLLATGRVKERALPPTITKERNLIEDCDFDQRILNLTQEIFDAYSKSQDKLWLRQINRSKEISAELNALGEKSGLRVTLLIDRLDESWDGSESAIICLMALMHATVKLCASTPAVRPYIFIRENIYDRIRSIDNEFARLETAVVFLDWSEQKLVELVERRLVRPFPAKPKLGGEAWSCFFEESAERSSRAAVMALCQHRPRDVLMLTSYAIEAAINGGHQMMMLEDVQAASRRYSTSRLKDLGDEFAENYPNISVLLELFYGLGTEYSLIGIEDFIAKLLVNDKIKKHCASWFFDYTTAPRLVELLYGIGFLGLRRAGKTFFKEPGKDSNAKLPIDQATHFVIHPTYQPALNLRNILIQAVSEDTPLKNEGILEDLPDNYRFDQYKDELKTVLEDLKTLPLGHAGAQAFEEVVGKVVRLCFFRSLTNVQPKCRTVDGSQIRDWIASNRASGGFWDIVRGKYGATQVVFECKNYENLSADDFHQVQYYFSETFGRFGLIFFRGSEIKDSYLRHIANVVNKNQAGLILPLTQRDLEVFLRQAINGVFKESHIQDKFDFLIRSIS
ncbi:transposase [Lampropedia puyangensis]|uniref:Transposase n=2 Tax=Lampropedia puyangensis TaxID=1330072 RepID=A0A4S8EMP1_9BURK|nr:transposase [Lampropedia puyangensis]